MASIELNQSYKTSCKYCGLVKKSSVPGNFVCKDCKKFCKQQLSEAELLERDYETSMMISKNCLEFFGTIKQFMLNIYEVSVSANKNVSNQQYLSVCRILKKEN